MIIRGVPPISVKMLVELLQSEETNNKIIQVESAVIKGNTTHVIYISDKPIDIREFQKTLININQH